MIAPEVAAFTYWTTTVLTAETRTLPIPRPACVVGLFTKTSCPGNAPGTVNETSEVVDADTATGLDADTTVVVKPVPALNSRMLYVSVLAGTMAVVLTLAKLSESDEVAETR